LCEYFGLAIIAPNQVHPNIHPGEDATSNEIVNRKTD